MDDLLALQQREIDTLRERIRQLEEALVPIDVAVPIEWRLTPAEHALFAHLTTRDVATKQSIMTALYSTRPDEEPEMKIVDVFVCKMRKKLLPYGVRVATVWGTGYALENRHTFSARAA